MRQFLTIISILILLSACRQDKKTQTAFKFEKLIFHAKGRGCEGYCSTFHLSLDSNKNVQLYAERVYKSYKEIDQIYENARRTKADTVYKDSLLSWKKMGYFKGVANNSTYTKLVTYLRQVNLDTLEFSDSHCCDGIDKTLIVYYNGKRKQFWSMFPPDSTEKIFDALYEIFHQDNFIRTDTFQLEQRTSR